MLEGEIHMEGYKHGGAHTRRDINTGETYTRGGYKHPRGHTHGGGGDKSRDKYTQRGTNGTHGGGGGGGG